jgi:ribonuclease R
VAEQLIEEFMLAANETVAKHVCELELPFIYRIHEKPKSDKLAYFNDFVKAFGYKLKGDVENADPKHLQRMLDLTRGKPEESVINKLLLRSMRQARYSEENDGHFGLAKTFYTHFTSPIRRYPDLIVHRLLRKYVVNHSRQGLEKLEEVLPDIADHTSKMERRAVEAERDTEELKKAEFMSTHVGETFEATISGVTKFGVFVELENTVEGLAHVRSMRDDHYLFDEKTMALIGKSFGREYRIGQAVTVKLKRADVLERSIDFEIVVPKTKRNPKSFDRKDDKKGQKPSSKSNKSSKTNDWKKKKR